MRIAFVTPAYYPAIIGASLYCQLLAEGLSERGHEVDVYVNAPRWMKKEEVVNGIAVKRFYPKVVGSYYISTGMLSSLLKKRYNIIHSHHFGYYPATAGLIAAKLTKTKHIFGPYYHPPIYGLKKQLMFTFYHLTQGIPLLRLSNRVLPHTNFEKELLLKVGALDKNIELLPNAVDTDRFKPGKEKKENIVLFVANFIQEKGAHIAFDLAERMIATKDVKFVFIGHLIDRSLAEQVMNLKKTGKAVFLSNITEKELIKWYNKSSVIIFPSMYEAFGKVIAEAQACGTPAVVTNVGGFSEVIQNNKSGFLINYGDWNEMQEKIEFLIDNPLKSKRMGLYGRSHVKKKFDKKIILNKLERIYEELV